jgi:hypothetical protein
VSVGVVTAAATRVQMNFKKNKRHEGGCVAVTTATAAARPHLLSPAATLPLLTCTYPRLPSPRSSPAPTPTCPHPLFACSYSYSSSPYPRSPSPAPACPHLPLLLALTCSCSCSPAHACPRRHLPLLNLLPHLASPVPHPGWCGLTWARLGLLHLLHRSVRVLVCSYLSSLIHVHARLRSWGAFFCGSPALVCTRLYSFAPVCTRLGLC